MRVGRNDPCHCGSGKKYKKCCLSKDEAARPAYEPAVELPSVVQDKSSPSGGTTLPAPKAAQALTPQQQAQKDRWAEFERADFDTRIALFEQTLTEPDILDADLSLDLFLGLRDGADTAERRRQVSSLVDRLREQLPAVYENREPSYTSWRITEALDEGRHADVVALATRMGELAGQHIDEFNVVYNQLAWHGLLEALTRALSAGWPRVRKSRKIVPWGVDEFADKGAYCVMFEWLDRCPDAREVDTELREAVSFFLPDLTQPLDAVMARLAGWSQDTWAASDFQFLAGPPNTTKKRPRQRTDDDTDDEASNPSHELDDDDPEETRLWNLGLEFIGYARNQEDIPFTKGRLFEDCLTAYLRRRRAGDLEQRESILTAMSRPSWKSPPKRKPPVPDHPLCPDARSLDRFLADRLNILGYRPYHAAVTLELLPAWLRFLVARGLLDPAQHARTLDKLRDLARRVAKLLRDHDDPALAKCLDQWPAITPTSVTSPLPC